MATPHADPAGPAGADLVGRSCGEPLAAHGWDGPAILALRLGLARTVAWALLLFGWVVLGALGRQWVPLWVGGLAPLAVWLAAIGAALALGQRHALSGAALRATVAACAAIAAVGCLMLPAGGQIVGPFQATGSAAVGAVLVAALAWGGLLVAASRIVKGLRQAWRAAASSARGSSRPGMSPARPALAAAVVVGVLLGLGADGLQLPPATLACVLLACAALLVGLAAPRVRATGCPGGLFDCALPFPVARAEGRGWPGSRSFLLPGPQRTGPPVGAPRSWASIDTSSCARLTMLPMMASLALMLELCAAPGGPSVALLAFGHLIAMLLPAAVLGHRPVARWCSPRQRRALAGVALVAGGWVLMDGFHLGHWMAASLLHALAWGLAWSARLDGAPDPAGPGPAPALPAPVGAPALSAAAAALPALAVLTMGAGLQLWGPSMLMAFHLLIATLAGVTALARLGSDRAMRCGGRPWREAP